MKHLEITMKVILQITHRFGARRTGTPRSGCSDGFTDVGFADHFAYESVSLGVNTRYFPKIST